MLTKEIVQSLLTKTHKINPKKVKKLNLTHYNTKDFYMVYYNINPPKCDNIKCETYGNELPFDSFQKGFTTYCNKKCCNTSYRRTDKIKQTNIERYGNPVSMNSKMVRDKIKQNNLELYNVEHSTQRSDVKLKIKETFDIKYQGNMSADENVKSKKIETMIKKYNVINPSQMQDHKKKVSDTIKQKYNKSTSEFFKEIYNKQTLKPNQHHITNIDNLTEDYLLNNFVDDKGYFLVQDAIKYFNTSYNMFAPGKTKFKLPVHKRVASITQNIIFELIPGSIMNDRQFIKPLEIDILNHDLKLGIEYHGLMWHSYGKSNYSKFNNYNNIDPNRHKIKADLVEEKGYQLFQIFEDEWVYKREIWESMLKSKMQDTTKIQARKCVIKELTSLESNNFIEDNHIQGKINASVRLGLFYQDELVACMTFGKSRLSKQYQWELYRYCNKLNITVIGGFSKLLKYFERTYNPESLVSYANRRWSTGNVYKVNGFTFSHNSTPNHFYIDKEHKMYSRMQFQKHKLKDKLKNFNPDISGVQNMLDAGYRIIYDAGNLVYFKKY